MPKNIVICCDGTGNQFGEQNSNVVKLYETLVSDAGQVAYYHPGTGTWYYVTSSNGQGHSYTWGAGSTAVPVPGDYDGDGITAAIRDVEHVGGLGLVERQRPGLRSDGYGRRDVEVARVDDCQ